MRLPFGRGARQRELEGLRQRIAELHDEITKIQDSLEADSPDIETTDAYRSVQLLRESMRREELATLHEELRGLEARVATLTASRQLPANNASATRLAADASPLDVQPSPLPAAEPSDDAISPTEQEAPPTIPPRAPVVGHGLPSERAIIEPALTPRTGAAPDAAPAAAEGVGTESEIEAVADGPAPTDEQPADEPPAAIEASAGGELGEPIAVGEQREADAALPVASDLEAPAIAEPSEAEEPPAAEEPAALEPAAGEEPTVAEPQAVEGREPSEPAPVPVAVASADEAEVAQAEPDEQPVAEATARRSSRWVSLLLALSVIVIAVVLALESGLIGPLTGSTPGVPATALPTRPAATPVPTVGSPTPFPTIPPTAAPPTVPPVAAAPDEAFTIEGVSPADIVEAATERATIAAPVGFTGALLRETPILAARNLQFLPNGAAVEILPGNATGSGFTWLRVRSTDGVVGWIISTVLGR